MPSDRQRDAGDTSQEASELGPADRLLPERERDRIEWGDHYGKPTHHSGVHPRVAPFGAATLCKFSMKTD